MKTVIERRDDLNYPNPYQGIILRNMHMLKEELEKDIFQILADQEIRVKSLRIDNFTGNVIKVHIFLRPETKCIKLETEDILEKEISKRVIYHKKDYQRCKHEYKKLEYVVEGNPDKYVEENTRVTIDYHFPIY